MDPAGIPGARLERQWPGGPVRGTFTARYGPDSRPLDTFTLKADSADALPAMLAQAVERIERCPVVELGLIAIAGGIVRGGVRTAAIGDRLDERRATAVARAIESQPAIRLRREEVTALPADGVVIVATGVAGVVAA